MPVGEAKSSEIAKNKDGDLRVRLLQVEISDPDDLQTVQLMTAGGEDFVPPDGSIVVLVKAGDAWQLAVAVDDNVEPASDLEKGERELYASDGGVRKVKLRLKKDGAARISNDNGSVELAVDGTITLNEGTEPVIKGDAFADTHAAHTHPTAFGPSGPPLEPVLPSNFNDTVLV